MDTPRRVWEALTKIKGDPENPKDHDRATIKGSFRRFGFVELPVIDERTGRLVSGHGRVECLLEMKAEGEKPPARVRVKGNEWMIQVLRGIRFKNEIEAKAYLVAANSSTIRGGFKESALASLLERIRSRSTLDGIGYTKRDVDKLIARAALRSVPREPANIARPESSRIKIGETWQLGDHLLHCGDSRDVGLWARLLDGELAGMVMADPPYGMGKEKDGVKNDNLYGPKLDEFQTGWWKAVRPVLEATASVYVWGQAEDLWRWWYGSLAALNDTITFRNELVWEKPFEQGQNDPQRRSYPNLTERALFFALGRQGFGNLNVDRFWDGWEPLRLYLEGEATAAKIDAVRCKEITGTGMFSHWFSRSQWSLISEDHYEELREASGGLHFRRSYAELKKQYDELRQAFTDWLDHERGFFDNTHEKLSDVWKFDRVEGAERFGHATAKPVLMMVRAIRSSARTGSIVIDPFAGTGPVLLACEQIGRRCIAADEDPLWCEVVIQRWESLTGRSAFPRGQAAPVSTRPPGAERSAKSKAPRKNTQGAKNLDASR